MIEWPNWALLEKRADEGCRIRANVDTRVDLFVDAKEPIEDLSQQDIRAMLNCLGGAIFESEFPGEWLATFRWEAEAVANGLELSEKQKAMIARRNLLRVKG